MRKNDPKPAKTEVPVTAAASVNDDEGCTVEEVVDEVVVDETKAESPESIDQID